MKSIISLFAAFTLALSTLAFAGESEDKVLGIYKTEFSQYSPATCATARGYLYDGQLKGLSYTVTQVIMWDNVEYVIVQDAMAEEYFYIISAEGEVTETHHDDWDAQLKNSSSSFYGLIHNDPNDCGF